MSDTAARIVLDFCRAWERRDLAAILAPLSTDIAFQIVPRPAIIGREAVKNFVKPLVQKTTAIEFRMLSLAVAEDGVSVLTERIDILTFGEKSVSIPLMGIFVVREGLITQWRDYADGAAVAAEFVRAGINLGG